MTPGQASKSTARTTPKCRERTDVAYWGDYYKGKTFSQGTFVVDGNSVDPGQMVPFDLRYIREFQDWVVTVGSSNGNSVSFTYSPSQKFDYSEFKWMPVLRGIRC